MDNELYRYRMLYNAAFFNLLARNGQVEVCKSRRHSDGEKCFGSDDWFIVMAMLPTGQVSNHYESKYWDLFDVPERETSFEYDGHTPNEAADRLEQYLNQKKSGLTFEEAFKKPAITLPRSSSRPLEASCSRKLLKEPVEERISVLLKDRKKKVVSIFYIILIMVVCKAVIL